MTKIKQEEFLNWNPPEVHLQQENLYPEEEWEVIVNPFGIEITFSWDHGYEGRGSNTFSLPIDKLEEILAKVKS